MIITQLNKAHDRKRFDCGDPSLNQYFHRFANQDVKRGINRVFVATSPDNPRRVMGYYSISAASLDATTLPNQHRKKLPGYPIPVALLGRLATATENQRQGLGAMLIADALQRVTRASQTIAVYALVVDAINEAAAQFYQSFGFIRLPDQQLKLFLPLKTVAGLETVAR